MRRVRWEPYPKFHSFLGICACPLGWNSEPSSNAIEQCFLQSLSIHHCTLLVCCVYRTSEGKLAFADYSIFFMKLKLDDPSMSKDFSALHKAVNSPTPAWRAAPLCRLPWFSRAVSHFLLCHPRVVFEARTPAHTIKQPYSSHTFLSWEAGSLGTQHSALRVQSSDRTWFYGMNLFTYDCSVGNHGTPRLLRTQPPGQWPERYTNFCVVTNSERIK